jgi:hypothetical protein
MRSYPSNACDTRELAATVRSTAAVACETACIALVSVVINNYNYGRFLGAALDSALAQSPKPEVVVVDDGSTDDSREIIASYGTDVVPVLKENGGQTSALNAGFKVATGDPVIFLDADDILLPGAVERVLKECAADSVAKAHWQMRGLEEDGTLGDDLVPPEALSQGDLRELLLRDGPGAIESPPTSGNAWSRHFLEAVCPLSHEFEQCADAYLGAFAPLHGTVVRIEEPLSAYRRHEASHFAAKTFDTRVAIQRTFHDCCCEALEQFCAERGLPVDRERWDLESWICPLEDLAQVIQRHVPIGETFIIIDDDEFDMDATGGRPAVPLMVRDGMYWGSPEDDAEALAALDAHEANGIRFLALAPPSRWWLDEYARFFARLTDQADVLFDDGQLTIYGLRGARRES